ncbi:GAP family protein [Microbacterium sp. NPDC089189]|uniref:GAP family protein n=1 Tax=Microbacterium sp. NPDC089189 TaxID=3154972 RepID=UPI003428D1B2
MTAVLGELLPLAVGIAISPVPIIAAILMLLSPRARSTGVGFLIGWVVGVVVAVSAFTLLASIVPHGGGDGATPVTGAIRIVLGTVLLLLAGRQWRSRPPREGEQTLPAWMAAVDSMTAVRALLLGFALVAVNPKNLLMSIAAGMAVGSGGLSVGSQAALIAAFTLLASSSVLIPVLGYVFAAKRMAKPLESMHTWLLRNNAAVMTVLLLVIGVVLVGKGLTAF